MLLVTPPESELYQTWVVFCSLVVIGIVQSHTIYQNQDHIRPFHHLNLRHPPRAALYAKPRLKYDAFHAYYTQQNLGVKH
jgi:hypothetical protein